jgi:amidohydrolase
MRVVQSRARRRSEGETQMPARFLEDAQALAEQMTAVRRDLHAHPELGFQEVRTARIVAEELGRLGYEVVTGVGKTGVVGLMGGARAGDHTVMLRFDMDALPIHELNDVPYRSQTPGVMHACGHDAHVAVGLGVASILAKHREAWGGTIKLMFQPAEEGLGGAVAMINDGLLEGPRPEVALGLHVSSGHPLGRAVVRSGALLAAADLFEITVKGRGGHGARPHETVDAVVVAAQIVGALQTIVSRGLDPEGVGVVTVGSILAGNAGNVIADSALLRGTVRTFDTATREMIHRRIAEIASGIAGAFGATAATELTFGTPPTVNAVAATEVVHAAAAEVLGADQINTTFRTTGGEDFAEVLARVPGNFFFIGARNEELGFTAPHHNPHFDIDERCMPLGAAILCDAAVRCLEGEGLG